MLQQDHYFYPKEQNPPLVLLFKKGFKDRNIAMYNINKVGWNYCRPQQEHLT